MFLKTQYVGSMGSREMFLFRRLLQGRINTMLLTSTFKPFNLQTTVAINQKQTFGGSMIRKVILEGYLWDIGTHTVLVYGTALVTPQTLSAYLETFDCKEQH